MTNRFSFVLASALPPEQRQNFIDLQREFRNGLTPKERAMLPEPHFEPDAFIAFDGSAMVGFLTFQQYRDVLRFPTMYVKAAYRPLGLGVYLIEQSVRWIQKHSSHPPTVVKWRRAKSGKDEIRAISDFLPLTERTIEPKPQKKTIGERLREWRKNKGPKPV